MARHPTHSPSLYPYTSRVVLVDSEPTRMASVADRVRGEAEHNLDLRIVSSISDASEPLWHVAVVNVEALPKDPSDARRVVSNLASDGHVLLYGAPLGGEDFSRVLSTLDAVHVFDWRGEPDDACAVRHLSCSIRKMLHPLPFGLKHYFGPRPPHAAAMTFRDTKRLKKAIDDAENFIEATGVPRRHAQKLLVALDEITKNALFSAATDDNGLRRYAHLSRRKEVELRGDETVIIRVAVNDELVGFSVQDPFGTLIPREITSILSWSLRGDKARMRAAGVGLFMAFRSVNHLVFNSEPGVRTEVIGLLERQRGSANTSLGIFTRG